MGDVAMTVPVIRAAKQQNPNIKITVLTRVFFAPFFNDIPEVEVYAADLKGKHKGIKGLYQLAKELQKLKIDAVADLHNVLRTKILKIFWKGKNFISIDKGRKQKIALIKGTIFKQLKTTHQRYADVFIKLGVPITLQHPVFPKKAKLPKTLIEALGGPTSAWVGVAPLATYPSKMYPFHLLEKVLIQITKNHQVFLFGGNSDKETLQKLCINGKIKNLAGRFTLQEELAIISNLQVMLSMDSGNAHIAAMLGVPVVTIWGVTHPYTGFAPFNQPASNCLLANREKYPLIPTSVYGNTYPKSYEQAASSIASEKIIDKIEEIIKKETPL